MMILDYARIDIIDYYRNSTGIIVISGRFEIVFIRIPYDFIRSIKASQEAKIEYRFKRLDNSKT